LEILVNAINYLKYNYEQLFTLYKDKKANLDYVYAYCYLHFYEMYYKKDTILLLGNKDFKKNEEVYIEYPLQTLFDQALEEHVNESLKSTEMEEIIDNFKDAILEKYKLHKKLLTNFFKKDELEKIEFWYAKQTLYEIFKGNENKKIINLVFYTYNSINNEDETNDYIPCYLFPLERNIYKKQILATLLQNKDYFGIENPDLNTYEQRAEYARYLSQLINVDTIKVQPYVEQLVSDEELQNVLKIVSLKKFCIIKYKKICEDTIINPYIVTNITLNIYNHSSIQIQDLFNFHLKHITIELKNFKFIDIYTYEEFFNLYFYSIIQTLNMFHKFKGDLSTIESKNEIYRPFYLICTSNYNISMTGFIRECIEYTLFQSNDDFGECILTMLHILKCTRGFNTPKFLYLDYTNENLYLNKMIQIIKDISCDDIQLNSNTLFIKFTDLKYDELSMELYFIVSDFDYDTPFSIRKGIIELLKENFYNPIELFFEKNHNSIMEVTREDSYYDQEFIDNIEELKFRQKQFLDTFIFYNKQSSNLRVIENEGDAKINQMQTYLNALDIYSHEFVQIFKNVCPRIHALEKERKFFAIKTF
jgi:hypothetical protein